MRRAAVTSPPSVTYWRPEPQRSQRSNPILAAKSHGFTAAYAGTATESRKVVEVRLGDAAPRRTVVVLVPAATGERLHGWVARRRETKQLPESQLDRGDHARVRMGVLKPHPTRACEHRANVRSARVCPRWTGVC